MQTSATKDNTTQTAVAASATKEALESRSVAASPAKAAISATPPSDPNSFATSSGAVQLSAKNNPVSFGTIAQRNQSAAPKQELLQGSGLEEEELLQGSGIEEEELLQGSGIEEEELLQGSGIEEEELLQGSGIEEEELLQGSGIEDEELLQGSGIEEEEPLQGSGLEDEELQMKAKPNANATVQRKAVNDNTGSGSALPDAVRAKMESSMSADFSDVRVHANSAKANDIGAHAYAQGTDIHMAPGKYDPASQSGQELLGHELAHVVQQREGRVKPTAQAKGLPVNNDEGLEHEADVLGAKAARSQTPAIQQKTSNATTIGPMPLQRKGVAQLEGDAPAVEEPEPEVEMEENEVDEGEQDVPIPPFPSVSAEEAEQEEEEAPIAPPLPPRPQNNRPLPPPPLPPRPAAQNAPVAPPPAAAGPAPELPRRINPQAGGKSRFTGNEKVNYNEDGGQDYAEYGILGSGAAAAGASATTKGLQYGDTLVKGGYGASDLLKAKVPEASTFGETASAVSGLGVAGGALGTMGAVADGVRAGQYMADKDKATSDRVMGGGGAMLSAAGSGLKESSTMAYHAATLAKDATAAGGAAAMAGIGSVAMGSADVIRGTYGAVRADQRATRLQGIAHNTENRDVHSAATQAASTQQIRKSHAKGTVFKGLLLVAGGATLIIMGSNPIGWGLLAGAAIVGGIIGLRRYLQKKARKKDVAIRELGVAEEYKAYQDKKAERKKNTNVWTRRNLPKIESPLDREMVKRGYKPSEYGKFYADYIHDTAWVMYNLGVLGDQSFPTNKEMRDVIKNMGLEVVDKESPKPEVIAKNLHN